MGVAALARCEVETWRQRERFGGVFFFTVGQVAATYIWQRGEE